MSLDPTLKTHGGLRKSRSVLKRSERIARLVDEGKFDLEAGTPLGLPKTKIRHSKAGMKTKKVEETPVEASEAVEGEASAGEDKKAETKN
jgi:small basic protein (TIGR04137 family)